jgi:hypothetical protein
METLLSHPDEEIDILFVYSNSKQVPENIEELLSRFNVDLVEDFTEEFGMPQILIRGQRKDLIELFENETKTNVIVKVVKIPTLSTC